MRTIIIGGDGFCGWPSSLKLSEVGHDVLIVDNLSRRKIDVELGVESITPISNPVDRIACWNGINKKKIQFVNIDVCTDVRELVEIIKKFHPDNIIHFGEQRAAPYSMKNKKTRCYTVNNNIVGTHNVLSSIVESGLDIHLIHLGTMGVYGYSTAGLKIPEGYIDANFENTDGDLVTQKILYPTSPGSIYHMTKSLDQIMFGFYAKNYGVKITDLHQGIVWGTQTAQTEKDVKLLNRFDYDGDYGTVLNRFIMQAAIGYPLTVHGTGGQTRAFIHITDTVKCIEIACNNPPNSPEPVQIFNQVTETHTVNELAKLISRLTGANIEYLTNPRKEAPENELNVDNSSFIKLGLQPVLLETGLLDEIFNIAKKYSHRVDEKYIPCVSNW